MQTDNIRTGQSIRAILSDVGGVLIHKTRTPALQQWEQTFGLQALDLPLCIYLSKSSERAMVGQATVDEIWDEFQHKCGFTDSDRVAFLQDFAACDQRDEELIRFLQTLRPHISIALLSNAWPGSRYSFGTVLRLAELADMMILSCEEGLAKPDPRIYDLAAERLQLPHEAIIFIDDAASNVAAAQACGMHGIVCQSSAQTIAELQTLLALNDF